MPDMNRIDPLDIDGRLLALLVAVVEEQSITRAAERLGVTQSAVSHALDRLRSLSGEALVVRSGRGVVTTDRARVLAARARDLISRLHQLADNETFDPTRLTGCVQIAANPLQRDLLLPALLARLRRESPRLSLRVLPSDVPSPTMLRETQCQLVLSPRLPDAGDIIHKRLFDDHYSVFFDPAQRAAPADLAEYEASDHVVVMHAPQQPLLIDAWLDARGIRRTVVVEVADFSGARPFIAGTARIATLPALLRLGALTGLAQATPPFACEPLPMYALWHQRYQDDPMHRWLRGCLDEACRDSLGALRAPPQSDA